MKLYHLPILILTISGLLLVTSCNPVQAPPAAPIQVSIVTADETLSVEIPAGSSVQTALEAAGLELGELDRVEPPAFTMLADGSGVRLVRVTEEFYIEQVVIPYEARTLRNEALPDGERRLVQAGSNGMQEITYRVVYEDYVEISRSAVRFTVVEEAVPEIIMIGTQSAFTPVSFPGRMVYLASGNAWSMDGATGERQPVVTTGDLDGRIFSLSDDRNWLLFTRAEEDEDTINSLWAARLDEGEGRDLIDLQARNVIHFAAWVPNYNLRVAYSTVEPRATAPGWQANNDLYVINFSVTGWISRPLEVIESNAGGVYGWWGTNYSWSPNGSQLAFTRPDGIGLVDFETNSLQKLYDVTPYQTFGDWAWVPGLAWSPDGNFLFSVAHGSEQAGTGVETSQAFDVVAISLEHDVAINLVSQVGMFAYPVPSPLTQLTGEGQAYQVAYLQAIFPGQSDTSRYQLVVMDRDGSNPTVLFPADGSPGLEPQRLVWGPPDQGDGVNFDLAFTYQGNLWLADSSRGLTRQLTGDGQIIKIDWK
jgi:resuscitation-promoting factor RpfB